jgi:excisionase family DNA binding protein
MEKRTVGAAKVAPELKVLVSVDEAAEMLSIGRTFAYALVRANELRSIKVGRTRRVLVSSLHDYVGRLMTQAS